MVRLWVLLVAVAWGWGCSESPDTGQIEGVTDSDSTGETPIPEQPPSPKDEGPVTPPPSQVDPGNDTPEQPGNGTVPPGTQCNCDSDCLAVDGHEGVCFQGICMTFASTACSAAGSTAECAEGSRCWMGLCWPDCASYENCDGVCDSDGSCAPTATTSCDPSCGQLCGTRAGGACASDQECLGGSCYLAPGWIDGYCLAMDCGEAGAVCGPNSICVSGMTSDGTNVCMGGCEGGCRPGYLCMAGAAGEQSCYPGCDPAADGCPGGYYCGEVVTESGATINRCLSDFRCSDERPFDGDCPRGQVCEAGECVDFLCETPGALEPNESEAEQATVEGTIEGLQICADDEDWFVFQPAAADVVHQIGVASFYGSGDLDVELRNVAGEVVEEAWLRPDDYHEENGRGPIEYEGFAMVGSGQADPFTLRVFGVGGATNNYDLVYEQLPWIDGPSCPGAGFTEAECTAVEGGRFNVDQLVMFPMGHDDDPYIGDGVFFRSGLSYGGYRYIPSSVLWGRRDLVMALRYAIHTVQEEFPGTQPLGIGELGMPDGTTCAGHPNFTHHYGGNVDVSYYIVDGAQREWGNMCYRHICNDTDSLLDWSCVDTDGSAGQFGECITGCGEGHIVDIPRTARFMAAVAESGRLRVWGADTIVDAELDAELGRLASEGVAGAADARMRMATANDHNSWVWHFNHLHISFD